MTSGLFAFLALLVLTGALVATVVYYMKRAQAAEYRVSLAEQRSKQLAEDRASREGSARATIKGQISEQIAPLLPGFPWAVSDYRTLGGEPVDFIVFVGLTDCKDGGDPEIVEVVIGDVKQGGSRLSRHQQAIKRAVEGGRVRWHTLRLSSEFAITPGIHG